MLHPGLHSKPRSNNPTLAPWRALARALLVGLTLVAFAVSSAPAMAQPAEQEELEAQSKPRKHRKRKKRPIVLGVSGGNINDSTVDGGFITCASGTLGGLLEKNGVQYIVSNNHVLALVNKGRKGDPINQPGLIDKQCRTVPEEFVATLSAYKKLKFRGNNFADVAVAEVLPGAVKSNGKVLRVGVPGNEVMDATLGLRVQKAGRTTGLTKGQVVLTGATLNVDFSAAGIDSQPSRTAKFKNQIVIQGTTEPFSNSGDSGSMIFEDVNRCPRAVALLFAGNQEITVGSPMEKVLTIVSKLKPKGETTLVGCNPSTSSQAGQLADSSFDASGVVTSAAIHSFNPDREAMIKARLAQRRHENDLLEIRGVTGVGIGRAAPTSNSVVLTVLVEEARPEILERIPAQLDGIPTQVMISGRIKAF